MPEVIYRPKGRAAEYSLLAINHYAGCTNCCKYCYLRQRYGKREANPHPKPHVLKNLLRQVPKFAGTKERVLLSFSSDPYQLLEREFGLSRDILAVLHQFNIPFQVLTKGGILPSDDFDLYTNRDAFAVTLTFLDRRWRAWEPHAAPPWPRIYGLELAHEAKIETWVSLEPVLDAEQSLKIIRETHPFVDLYKIGKLNYMESDIDWRDFGRRAIELCEKLSKPYFIKSDLAKHLGGIPFKNTDNRKADWRSK